MALAGRLRSTAPLFHRILRAESVLLHRSAADQSYGNPIHSNPQCLRNFATEVKLTEAKIKVPLSLFGGSGNYATALFIAASKVNMLDKVESEIQDIIVASKNSALFSQFIKDLSVPRGTRVKAVKEIFSSAGFSDVTKNFLAVLADNGRLRYIERIAKRFSELTMAHKGLTNVTVRTVIPLPAEEEKELKLALQELLGKGKTVKIEQKIDQNILGGLVIEFGQKVFDMSIRTRAKQMEKFLREPLDFDKL